MPQLLARGLVRASDRVDALEEHAPVLAEDRLEHLVLRREVVVEQAVRDARLLGDVADARRVEALVREHAHGRVEDQTPFLFGTGGALGQGRRRVVVASPRMQALGGMLVVDLTRYLPGRVRLERASAPRRPRRSRSKRRAASRCAHTAAEWHDVVERRQGVGRLRPAGRRRLRAGAARPSGRRARVVPPGRRRPARRRARTTCRRTASTARSPASAPAAGTSSAPGTTSTTSAGRACSTTTAPALPPVQVADLAAGALGAVTEMLAALLRARAHAASGARIVVSMTHGSQRSRRGRRCSRRRFACYSIYECADGRRLTVAALEPKFFARLCELRRPSRARRAAVRREPGGARAASSRTFSRGSRWNTGCACSIGRTCAWGRSRRWPRRPPSSACLRTGRAPRLGAHTARAGGASCGL